jgi:GMP reductase
MRLEEDRKLDFDDVLIRPKRSTLSSRKEVDLTRTYVFPHSSASWSGIPLIASNMDGVGTFSMMGALLKHGMLTALHKFYPLLAYKALKPTHAFVTIGIKEDDILRLRAIAGRYRVEMICIDVANGYTERFVEVVKRVRSEYPDKIIMAGNVVTGEMTEELILSGADIVKVGIGPGSVCTTRKMTGVGYPQLSAVIECADAAHGLKGLVCSDGGCKVPGDIAKAFGAGADFVMTGSMLAGHKESEMRLIKRGGKRYVEYYGSSSHEAMKRHGKSGTTYRASEGKLVLIPYRGNVDGTVLEILGGLRSACTYVGAVKLKELSKRTTFIRVSRQFNTLFE